VEDQHLSARVVRAKREAAPPKKPKAKIILAVLTITAATAGTAAWAAGRGKQSTDDAFVEAHVASVASRIQGQVERVTAETQLALLLRKPKGAGGAAGAH
jgi:multidrug resistance efflux pump